MAVTFLTSAGGSPGTSTTALGLAMAVAEPALLVNADPAGGDVFLSGYLRGAIPATGSMIDLAIAVQERALSDFLPSTLTDIPQTKVQLIAGSQTHTQSVALRELWPVLAEELATIGRTGRPVFIDGGRLGLKGYPEPLSEIADQVLLVLRSSLVSIARTRSWAESFREKVATSGLQDRCGLIVIGENDPYSARDISQHVGLPVVATLPKDDRTAKVLSQGAGYGWGKIELSPLTRGISALSDVLIKRTAKIERQIAMVSGAEVSK